MMPRQARYAALRTGARRQRASSLDTAKSSSNEQGAGPELRRAPAPVRPLHQLFSRGSRHQPHIGLVCTIHVCTFNKTHGALMMHCRSHQSNEMRCLEGCCEHLLTGKTLPPRSDLRAISTVMARFSSFRPSMPRTQSSAMDLLWKSQNAKPVVG